MPNHFISAHSKKDSDNPIVLKVGSTEYCLDAGEARRILEELSKALWEIQPKWKIRNDNGQWIERWDKDVKVFCANVKNAKIFTHDAAMDAKAYFSTVFVGQGMGGLLLVPIEESTK